MSTLNENILKVKETFDDIASAIEEKGGEVTPCDSPLTYADKIRLLNTKGGGLDPEKLYVEAYDAGDANPTVMASATDDGGVMLTFGLKRGASGQNGKDGKDGKNGKDGKDGKDGADGMDGSTYEYVYFRGISASDKPNKPAAGIGNTTDDYTPTETKTVYVNGSPVILKWSDKAQGVDETYKFEWQSERKKNSNNIWDDFSAPILWAKYGEKGKDGDGIQYIFKLTKNYKRPEDKITPDDYLINSEYQGLESTEYVPTELGWTDDPVDVSDSDPYCWVAIRKYKNGIWEPYSIPTLWAKFGKDGKDAGGDGTTGYKHQFAFKLITDESYISSVQAPTSVQTEDTPSGWTPSPKGVNPSEQVELVIQREKNTGIWGEWSDPAVWAMYGKIGRDGNGVEYIFCLTSAETIIPTLPNMDNTMDEYGHAFPLVTPDGFSWTDNPQSVTDSMTTCWVSMRRQYYSTDGEQFWGNLSNPSLWAKFGKDAKDGGGRTIFIYTGSNIYEPIPEIATPQGGTWDVNTNTLSNVSTTDTYEWTTTPPEKSETVKFIWQSVGNFNSAGSLIGTWSKPFCITGEDGHDGTDGVSKEFIYRLLPNKDAFAGLKEWLSNENNALPVVGTGKVPGVTDNYVYSDCDWKDEPAGIDGENYLIEVVCSRKAIINDSGEFTGWSKWSAPTLWAMWGEDGNDGPGVEYMFLVTQGTYKSNDGVKEMTSDVVLTYMPDITEMTTHPRYQEPGFVPNDTFTVEGFDYSGYDWTDEPSDVSPNKPMEWVSIRKGIVDQDTGNVSWGPFSKPKLWAKYSTDGFAYKTSYVFTREENIGQPHGGDFENAYPTIDGTPKGEKDPKWFDSIPEGTGSIWMSMRTFRSDDYIIDNDWSAPRKMTDTANFQVEFTATDLSKYPTYKPNNFGEYTSKHLSFDDAEEEWREAEKNKQTPVIWKDDVADALYMATAVCHNDVWEDWVVVKIKGEKGDTGKDGTSVEFKGSFETLNALKAEWSKYLSKDESAFGGELSIGNGYIIEILGENEEFNLYVYSGSVDPDNTNFENNWKGFNIKGEKGDKAELYIRYSDNGSTFTKDADGNPTGLTPGKYIGTLIGHGELSEDMVNDPNSYAWHMWNGEDGWGYEQIFVLTTEKYNLSNPPSLPDNENSDPEYYPDHNLGDDAPGSKWCDTPQPVSESYPYCWVATRKGEGNDFGVWKGTDDGHAVLYSRYSYDGNSAHYLELSEDQIVVPIENNTIDQDYINLYKDNPLTITMSLYAGDDTIENKAIYYVDAPNGCAEVLNPNEGIVTIYVDKLFNVNSIKCIAKYGTENDAKSFVKTLYIHKTETAYELIPDKSVLLRDPHNDNYLFSSDSVVSVTIKKWNGSQWTRPDSKLINAELIKIDGSSDDFIETDHVSWQDNVAVFDFSDEKDLSKIKFYIDGTDIFEEVGVIANGEDGVSQEYIYIRSKKELTDSEKSEYNPTPESIDSEEYQNPNYYPREIVEGLGYSWTDDAIGVSEAVPYEYISSRKKVNGKWQGFSNLALWGTYGKGVEGDSAWSWRLSDPIEMISYNSDGQINGTLSASTTVYANYGSKIAKVEITDVEYPSGCTGSYVDDTFIVTSLNSEQNVNSLTFKIKAKGTYNKHTDECELLYTIKKWFGEPATVSVHLSNDSTPVPTDSNGNYPNDIVRVATLTASSGTNPVTISDVDCAISGVNAVLDGNQLTITVSKDLTWSDDILAVPIACTLEGGFGSQTVVMTFYKVKATKEAEYPIVYDLIVNPNAIKVSVDQETGLGKYEIFEITPIIRKYTPDNETIDISVSDFLSEGIGSIKYSFDGEDEYDLESDSITVNGIDDADEYVDIVLIVNDKKQQERVVITHDALPNIDWELKLGCPDRIFYTHNGILKTETPNVSCSLIKTFNGISSSISSIPHGFDVVCELDGIRQSGSYNLNNIISLDTFTTTCEFILIKQGTVTNGQDVIYDRKLISKHYDPTPGDHGTSPIITQLLNPASVVVVDNLKFSTNVVSSDLQVRKGFEPIAHTVTIGSVKIDNVTKNPDIITLNQDYNNSSKLSNLTFELTSGVPKRPSSIEIQLNIVAEDKTYSEIKTINIIKNGESSVHLELTNDTGHCDKIDKNDQQTIPMLYDGFTKLPYEDFTLSLQYDENLCTAYFGDVDGVPVCTVSNIQEFPAHVDIVAKYNGGEYIKTFTVLEDLYQYRLSFNQNVINIDRHTNLECTAWSKTEHITNNYNDTDYRVEYDIDNKNKWIEATYNAGRWIIPTDSVKVSVTARLIATRDGQDYICDEESVGTICDGQTVLYYMLDRNCETIHKDYTGNIISPNFTIYPKFYRIYGNVKSELSFGSLSDLNFKLYRVIDGVLSEALTEDNYMLSKSNLAGITKQITYYLVEKNKTLVKNDDNTYSNWYDYTEIDVITDVKGTDAKSSIAVYLSNEFMKLSWFANGASILNTGMCKINATEGSTPAYIQDLDIVSCPDVLQSYLTVTQKSSSEMEITVNANTKIPVGTYPIVIDVKVNNVKYQKTITVAVDEIPNEYVDIVMDRSVHMPYLTSEQLEYDPWGDAGWFKWTPVVGQLWVLTFAIAHGFEKEYRTVYTPQTIDMTNINVFVNGVKTTNWEIEEIVIGKQSIGGPNQNKRNEWYCYDNENGNIHLNLHYFANTFVDEEERSELVCKIKFLVEGTLRTTSEVLLCLDKSATRYDFHLSRYTMNQGTSDRIYLSTSIVSENGASSSNAPLTKSGPKVELFTRKNSEKNGVLTDWQTDEYGQTYVDLKNIQEDQVYAVWIYDNNGNRVGHGRQIVNCIEKPVIDIWSLKTETPYVKVSYNAIENNGQLVGNPISISIQHNLGGNITTYNTVPAGYYVNVIGEYGENCIEERESLSIPSGQSFYKDRYPITFELWKYPTEDETSETLVDKITIEKTIVYPDPVIYPAGQYTESKQYTISYDKLPYVSFTYNNELKYFVGNKDVLSDAIRYTFTGGITISDGEIEIETIGDIPVWNEMESFEAIYADIGVLKQALVGPLVFYKNYVFSQEGVMIDHYDDYNEGDIVSYEDAIYFKSDFEDVLQFWHPHYLLNALTGDISLSNTFKIFGQDGNSIIDVGNHSEAYFDEIKSAKEKVIEVTSTTNAEGNIYNFSEYLGNNSMSFIDDYLYNNSDITIPVYTATEKGKFTLSKLIFRIGMRSGNAIPWISPEYWGSDVASNWTLRLNYRPYLLISNGLRISAISSQTSDELPSSNTESSVGKLLIFDEKTISLEKGESISLIIPANCIKVTQYNRSGGQSITQGKYRIDASYSFYSVPNMLVAGSKGIMVSSGKSFIHAEDGSLNIHSKSGHFTGLRTGVCYSNDSKTINGSCSEQTIICDGSASRTFILPPISDSKIGDFFELWLGANSIVRIQGAMIDSSIGEEFYFKSSDTWSSMDNHTLSGSTLVGVYKCLFTGNMWWISKIG